MIQFNCPQCRQLLQVPDGSGGKRVGCPLCKTAVTVPVTPNLEIPEVPTLEVVEEDAPPPPRSSPPPPAPPPQAQSNDEDSPASQFAFDDMARYDSEGNYEGIEEPPDPGLLKQLGDVVPEELLALGTPTGVYRSGNALRGWAIAGGCILIVLGMLCGLPTLVLLIGPLPSKGATARPGSPPPPTRGDALGPALLGGAMSLIMLAGGGALIFFAVRMKGGALLLCPRGFAIRRSGRIEVCRWDQVKSARQSVTRVYNQWGAHIRTDYNYTVRCLDGNWYSFGNGWGRVGQFGSILMRETTRALLPQAVRAYRSGRTLDFGPFGISQKGLSHKDDFVPWRQVRDLSMSRGELTVNLRGQTDFFARVRAPVIENLYVFLTLAEHAIEENRPQ